MARQSRKQNPNPEEPMDQGAVATESLEPRDGDAQVELKVRGGADAVLDRAAKMSRRRPRLDEEEIQDPEEPQDPTVALLADARNQVIVSRQLPRKWQGRVVSGEVDRYQCPITIEKLKNDVFARFGGREFVARIHPATPNGEAKLLGGFGLVNPDLEDPRFDEMQSQEAQAMEAPWGGVDSTLEPTRDPIEIAKKAMSDRTDIIRQKIGMKTMEKTLKDLDREDDDGQGRRNGHEAPEVAELRGRLDAAERRAQEVEKKSELDALRAETNLRLDRLEALIVKSQQPAPAPQADQGKGFFVEVMGMMQKQTNAMVEMMQKSQDSVVNAISGARRAPTDDVDAQLDRLIKLKQATGGDGDSETKKIKEFLFDMAFEKLTGGAASDEDDTIKYAIKQVVPVLKTYVEHQVERESAAATAAQRPLSKEELKAIYADAAKKAGIDIAQKLKLEGKIKNVPALEQRPPAQEPQDDGGREEVKTPPSPQAQGYDRRAAVDFVLDSALGDIKKGCPRDSYLIGDILDRLDDELLEQLCRVTSGAELEEFLRPHGDPAKVEAVKLAGQRDPNVKTWLSRIISTAQDEYRRETEEAEKKPQ